MTDQSLQAKDKVLDHIADTLYQAAVQGKHILVVPHIRADGDAIGSSLAVAHLLSHLGAWTEVMVSEPLDWTLRNMPGSETVQVCRSEQDCKAVAAHEVAVMLDCHEGKRLGDRAMLFERASTRIVMDHHVSAQETRDLFYIDPTAAAVGQIIFRLAGKLEVIAGKKLFDSTLAICLMSAILTDTGGFRFSNTTRETFAVASELMQYGVDVSSLSYTLLESMTEAKYRLIGSACQQAELHHEGRIGIVGIPRDILTQTHAEDTDTNGLANMIRAIDSVYVALVVREGDDGVLHVNVRSKEQFDSAAFARTFGGGGHTRAAGFDLPHFTLAEALPILVTRAVGILESA